MKAAITAAQRGFDVQLWERTDRLGGTLLQAGEPDFKKDVLLLVDYLVNKTFRSGVKVRLLKEAAAEEIIKGNFDKVVIAAGYLSNNELEDELEGKVKDLSVIGDAASPRKILDAVHEAYHMIRLMD